MARPREPELPCPFGIGTRQGFVQPRADCVAVRPALARSGQTWRLSTMSAISKTLEIGPPGQTIAKPCPRRFTRRYAFMRSARPVESRKSTLERSTTSGRSRSAKASLRAEIMRGAVAISSSPSTARSSYPSTRLRSTTSGFTAAGSLWTLSHVRATGSKPCSSPTTSEAGACPRRDILSQKRDRVRRKRRSAVCTRRDPGKLLVGRPKS
jgi:hypothetical protein